MKLAILLFFSGLVCFSQTFNGKVLKKGTDEPIEFVNVYIQKAQIGTVTNEKGEFTLISNSNVSSNDTIRFSILGYMTKSLTISELTQVNFIIHLSEKAEHLKDITITQKKELNNKLPFIKLAPMPIGTYNFGSALIENKIYVIGGDESFIESLDKKALDEVNRFVNPTVKDLFQRMRSNFSRINYSDKLQVYDIEKNSWALSMLEFRNRAYHKTIYSENNLFVLGGKNVSRNKKFEYLDNKIEILNFEKNDVLIDNTNPHQAINFTAVAYKNSILVLGGSIKMDKNGQKVYSNKCHMFNSKSGYWYELTEMTKAKEVNGILVNNKIYLIGGFNKIPLSEIESYNLIDGKWTFEGNLFSPIEYPALAYSDNIIYIYSNGKILTFNTESKLLNEYKIDLDLSGIEMQFHSNRLYIIGGFNESEYKKASSSNLYMIDVNDFYRTKISNSLILN